MILDTSAVVALLLEEPQGPSVLAKLASADAVAIGAPTLLETALVLSGRLGPVATSVLARFLAELAVSVLPFEERHFRVAASANLRFGRGRHPAALNFGDCLAYATASVAGRPLLATGDDFARTDLALA